MGCRASQVLPRGYSSGSENELLVDKEFRVRQRKTVLVEASHKVKATSGSERAQRIIDQITNGEDFELNHWRCLETPDRAYYTLGPFARLELEMVEARQLIPSVSGVLEKHFGDEPDSFVRVYVDDCLQYSTRCIQDSRCPQWRDKQAFDIVADSSFIRVHVYDADGKDLNTNIDPLGFVEFCIHDIPFDKEIDGWFELRFPQNLQGTNLERYAMHCEHREDSMRFDVVQAVQDARKHEHQEDETTIDKTKKLISVIPASLASRLMRRVRRGVTAVLAGAHRPEDDQVQFNAGEIRLRLKMLRVVPEGMDAFARALSPSCFTYATFVQEEYLPQLDLQELVDDAMDIKIQLLDDLVFALVAFVSYIVAWKSLLLSGLLLAVVVANYFSELCAWGLFHLWLAIVLLLMWKKRWRDRLSTNGLNAPLNQEGLEMVAAWNETSEMHCFLMRLVEARNGQITGMQELVHWAGTICVGRGELEITFDELLEAMHELWFIDMPLKPVVKKASLVYVGDDRRKGTVREVRGRIVTVVFDHALEEQEEEGDFDMEEVQPRIQPPRIPRMFVPKSVQGIVATLQYQIFGFHRQLTPYTTYLKDFFMWKKPIAMFFTLTYLLGRAGLALYGELHPNSWCFLGEEVLLKLRQVVSAILISAILFAKARGIRVVRGLLCIIISYCYPRNAPDCWSFFKSLEQPYRVPGGVSV